MLVFARKKNEWVDIGDEIEICVLQITGNKVRLGINAPKNLQVHRREVTLKINEQQGSEPK
jgi:carbon storage regulator